MPWRECLPHRHPACLVTGVTSAGGVLLDSHRGLDRWQLLEGCAQALAVLADGSGGGRLAALTGIRFLRPAVARALVEVRGTRGIRGGALEQWQVTADDQQGQLLSGVLTIASVVTPRSPSIADGVPHGPHAVDPLATIAGLAEDSFPAELPVLAGHFPGAPLVPGVYLLALLERRMGVSATGINRAKFLQPVLPGEHLVVESGRILRAGTPVCVATFTTG